MHNIVFDIKGLVKNYQDREVLRSIDLQVRSGEVVSIIGQSGSGKSTLVNEVLYKNVSNTLNKTNNRAGDCKEIKGD